MPVVTAGAIVVTTVVVAESGALRTAAVPSAIAPIPASVAMTAIVVGDGRRARGTSTCAHRLTRTPGWSASGDSPSSAETRMTGISDMVSTVESTLARGPVGLAVDDVDRSAR